MFRHRLALAAALVCSAIACDDTDDTPMDAAPIIIVDAEMDAAPPLDAESAADAAPLDAMPPAEDAAVDAAPPCGIACATLAWADGPPRPRVSDHHTTFIARGDDETALFVAGGIASDAQGGISDMTPLIHRAVIGADGSLGEWHEAKYPLPFPLAFHGQAQIDNTIWLAAGVSVDRQGPFGSRAVVAITVAPDARLDRVERCDDLPAPAVHPTLVPLDGRLYLIGGTTNAPIDQVLVGELGDDPCDITWSAGPSLPATRSHHAAGVYDGRIYVLGGFSVGQAPDPRIWRSVHDDTGALTGWEEVGAVDPAPWTSSALVIDDTLWLFGGGEGQGFQATFVNTVRRATFAEDGTVGPFSPVDAALPIARSHVHQTPLFDGRVYSVGGRVFDDAGAIESTDRVFIGTLTVP
ncbi:MAG: hypothetical protein KC620_14310 [Myxococcales bacterium]|nr:hypothetical protein [Myxococcales bacterium]